MMPIAQYTWSRVKTQLCSESAALVLLACLTAMAFLRVLWADFLGYDDPFYVTNNTLVQGGFSTKSLIRAWTTFECANWHPLTWMSLMLDHQLFGLRAWGFHLTNLMLHVGNTLLLYALLRRLQVECGPALFISAVFGVHPLHVESVAWVTERKDVLAGFFGLLSLLAYVRSVQTSARRGWWLSVVWFALSLCAKGMLVTLPCLLILLDYWPLQRHSADAISQAAGEPSVRMSRRSLVSFVSLVLEKWPYWLLSVGVSILTVLAQHEGGAVATLDRYSFSERLCNSVVSYCLYLEKTLWPTRLAVYYPYALNRWSPVWIGLAIALLGGLTLVATASRNRQNGVLLGWLWFLGTLVPMIGLVQVGTQSMADRYMYFALIGLTWALTALALNLWPVHRLQRPLQWLMGVSAVAILSVLTWNQTSYWQDSLSLARHTLAVTSDNYIAHEMHARALRIAGLNDQSIREYQRAIAINPEYFSARNDLGLLLAQQGDLQGAIEQLRLGLKTVPRHGRLRWNLANVLTKQGKFEAAEVEYRLAEEITPANDALVLDHARMLFQTRQYRAALTYYEQAVALDPTSLVNQLELAVALGQSPEQQGRNLPRSITLLEHLCAQTDAPRAWVTLAEMRAAAGRLDEAKTAWDHAIRRALTLRRNDLAEHARASQRRHQ